MDDAEQVAAFATAGRVDGIMSASYLFNSARISQVIQGCREVIDLGCGPATQLSQVAALNPQANFTGLDMSGEMLANAGDYVRSLGLQNVRFAQADMTRLDGIASSSVDAVISTLALHHLPSIDHLRECFREIKRVLKPSGSIYLVDLGRLKSLKSVLYFAYMNAGSEPHIFSLDYERSLRAAFLREDIERMCREHLSRELRVYTPRGVPVMVIAKTPDRPLPQNLALRLRQMRGQLSRQGRGDLDDIRLFFRLGGLPHDPFRVGA